MPPAFAWGEGPPRMPGYRSGGAKLPSPEGRQVSTCISPLIKYYRSFKSACCSADTH